MRSVAVNGIGIVSALGITHDTFRDALLAGASAVAPVSGFSTTECRSTLAAEIRGFDAAAWVSPMRMRRLDRTGVYALTATKLAMLDGGLSIAADGDDEIGVVLGTWSAGGQSTQQFLDALFRGGPGGAPALLFDSTVGNSAASLAALEHKLRGPNVTVSHKEASGLAAIVTAVDHLREGRARALFAGGVDAVYETFFKGHDRFRVMSRQAEFSAAVAPFDESRSGFVFGEGGFVLWLEPEGSRGERHTHGDVLGVSASSAAVAVNEWPSSPEALSRTMTLALVDAGVDAQDVDVVYASANGAVGLDAIEAQALVETFGSKPVVTSIKGALGEFGAGGAAACAAAFVCGRQGRVPPVAGLTSPDAAMRGLRLATAAVDAPGPIVLVNSVASGGALFSAVLRVPAR